MALRDSFKRPSGFTGWMLLAGRLLIDAIDWLARTQFVTEKFDYYFPNGVAVPHWVSSLAVFVASSRIAWWGVVGMALSLITYGSRPRWSRSLLETTDPPSARREDIKVDDPVSAQLVDTDVVALSWTISNCSSVSVENLSTTRLPKVRVVLSELLRYSDRHQQFIDGGLDDRSFPAELVGGGIELRPGIPMKFPFVNTVYPKALHVPLHFPATSTGNRELQIRRGGKWQARFAVVWGEENRSRVFYAEFSWVEGLHPTAGPIRGATPGGTAI